MCRGHAERREGSNKLFNLLTGTRLGIPGILGISRSGDEGNQHEECCAKVERFGKTLPPLKQYVTRVEDRHLPRLCCCFAGRPGRSTSTLRSISANKAATLQLVSISGCLRSMSS